MKRVENIHINGMVFTVEDDAFAQLSAYLEALNRHFAHEQGGNEIMADIEARMAELFAQRDGGSAQIVTTDDVAAAIAVLGTAEDITGEAAAATDGSSKSAADTEKATRRLYRDPDKRFVGGVCAGIANWVDIDPIFVRLVFIAALFLGGASAIVYLILWLIIPLAETTAQKLEMFGKPVNIHTIAQNIRTQANSSEFSRNVNTFADEAGSVMVGFFKILFRIIAICVGIVLILTGIGGLIKAFVLFFWQDVLFSHFSDWDFLSFNDLLPHIVDPAAYNVFVICAWVFVGLTVAACIFWGIKLVAGFAVKRRSLHVSLLVAWIIAVGACVGISLSEIHKLSFHNELNETQTLAPHDTLYIEALPMLKKLATNPVKAFYDKEQRRFYGRPVVDIRKSNDNRIRLNIEKEAQGRNKSGAYEMAENIGYNLEIKDSLLTFPALFTVQPSDKWRFQKLRIRLYVPVGTVIINKNRAESSRLFRYWRDDNCPEKWIMTSDGNRELK